jgi:hypothetical protein
MSILYQDRTHANAKTSRFSQVANAALQSQEVDSDNPFVDLNSPCNREDGENRANGENRAEVLLTPPSTALPLSALLSQSALLSLLHDTEKAITASLPTTEGQRNRCLFRLARHLKGIDALSSAEARALRPIVEEWHRRALPIISTKDFLESWAEFVPAWSKVKVPIGQGAIDVACERARASAPPQAATRLYGQQGPIVLLATLCRELQAIVGAGDFYLDCRAAGRFAGVDCTTAWRYLRVLVADGILAAGIKGSKVKASRFRFLAAESEF